MPNYEYWIPVTISLSAIVLTLLSFRRARRFENENHIYKLKVDIYSKLIAEFVKLIDGLQANVRTAKMHLENNNESLIEKLNESADRVDDVVLAFDGFLVSNSLVIPSKVLLRLNLFSEKLLNIDPIDELEEIRADNIKRLDKIVETYIKEANEIAAVLRKDVHIDKINAKLFNRLK